MGNKLGSTKRRQGLSQDIDIERFQKIMFYSQFAHRNPVDEKSSCQNDLEECPICFLYYRFLNTSRCCKKEICTNCFLRIVNPSPAQLPPYTLELPSFPNVKCPFCKASSYAVYDFFNRKTKEEKRIEQIEKQRVAEAKKKMKQKEVEEVKKKERMQKRLDSFSASTSATNVDIGESSSSQDVNVASEDMVPDNCNNSHYNDIEQDSN